MNNLGDKIKSLREAKGLTPEQLSEKLGFGRDYITTIETGDIKPLTPSLYQMIKIAGKLGVTSEYLADDDRYIPCEKLEKAAFFERFSRLSAKQQRLIMDTMDAIL